MQKFVKDVLPMTIGELFAVLAIMLGCWLLDLLNVITFDIRMVYGAILGAVVTVANYLVLIISVDREIDKYLDLRGQKQMSDEEAEVFTKQHAASIQKAVQTSSVLRTLSLVAALLVAFLTKLFNPIATIIPLLAYRPLLTIIELIKNKNAPKPDPQKYIKYDYIDEEKESD